MFNFILQQSTWTFLTVFIFLLSSCVDDDGSVNVKTNDCSVASRCSGQSDLPIRIAQVETYFFELEDDEETSFIDLAHFDYNENGQWVGGVTRRTAESDIVYEIQYANDKISAATKQFNADDDTSATIELLYSYSGDFLNKTVSETVKYDENDQVTQTIDETIDYSFSNGNLVDIYFDVSDSNPSEGDYSFHYEMTYENENENISDILVTQQSSGKPDYTFKSFVYADGKIISSTSYRLNDLNKTLVQDTLTYEYYKDGPIKLKTALTNSNPKQKTETHFNWEAGECNTNQVFVDRFYPTPEVQKFPCY